MIVLSSKYFWFCQLQECNLYYDIQKKEKCKTNIVFKTKKYSKLYKIWNTNDAKIHKTSRPPESSVKFQREELGVNTRELENIAWWDLDWTTIRHKIIWKWSFYQLLSMIWEKKLWNYILQDTNAVPHWDNVNLGH